MMTLDQIDAATPPPEPKRDGYFRYLITPADGGTPIVHTRATTWAKALDDQEGLINWSMRMTAIGLARRNDLYTQVASCSDDDTTTLRRLVDQAKEAGGASAKANLGTALHRFCERTDRGETINVPEPYTADVTAYTTTLQHSGLTIEPRWIERIAVVPSLKVAGTFDRILRCPDGAHIIADIKTGSLDYAALAISVQLALYANAETLYDPATGTHTAMPATLRRDKALVIHLPIGTGTCQLVEIDIATGWEYAQLCGQVRNARAHGKRRKDGLTRPWHGAPAHMPPTEPALDIAGLRAHLATRLATIKPNPAAKAAMAAAWPPDVPPFKPGHQHSADQLAQLLDLCARVEAAHELAFITDPRDITAATVKAADQAIAAREIAAVKTAKNQRRKLPDEGNALPDHELNRLRALVAAAEPKARVALNTWVAEATSAARPFTLRGNPTERRATIYQAALQLTALDDEELQRAALAVVLPGAAQQATTIGAALGSLTIDEALRVQHICEALDDGTAILAYTETGAATIIEHGCDGTQQEGVIG